MGLLIARGSWQADGAKSSHRPNQPLFGSERDTAPRIAGAR
ncbi:hypothetical protein [Glutamicibacter arilaitensis]